MGLVFAGEDVEECVEGGGLDGEAAGFEDAGCSFAGGGCGVHLMGLFGVCGVIISISVLQLLDTIGTGSALFIYLCLWRFSCFIRVKMARNKAPFLSSLFLRRQEIQMRLDK